MVDFSRVPSLGEGAVDGVVGNNNFVREQVKKRAGREVFDPLADDFHFGSGHNNFGDISLQAATGERETFGSWAGGARQGAVKATGMAPFSVCRISKV